jgi:hypothetical protein
MVHSAVAARVSSGKRRRVGGERKGISALSGCPGRSQLRHIAAATADNGSFVQDALDSSGESRAGLRARDDQRCGCRSRSSRGGDVVVVVVVVVIVVVVVVGQHVRERSAEVSLERAQSPEQVLVPARNSSR